MGPAKIGDITPTFVKADITFNVGKFNDNVRRDWDSLRPHDVLFLLAIKLDGPQALLTSGGVADVRQTHGLRHVRGCEIVGLVGPDGQLAEEFNYAGAARVFKIQEENFHVLQERKQREAGRNHKHYKDPVYRHPGHKRTYRVLLDVNQYAQDLALQSADGGAAVDIYGSGYFNAVVRRKPQENNFKPVLETIRDLIRTSEVVVPRWLHDVFLGYGDPRAAHYQNMSSDMIVRTIDFRDTFLDWKHLESSFPGKVRD